MIRIAHRDALAGDPPRVPAAPPPVPSGGGAAVRVRPNRGVMPSSAAAAADERERRSHIRRWAALMIRHLDEDEHDDARHYGYEEALRRLRVLIDRELARADAPDADSPASGAEKTV